MVDWPVSLAVLAAEHRVKLKRLMPHVRVFNVCKIFHHTQNVTDFAWKNTPWRSVHHLIMKVWCERPQRSAPKAAYFVAHFLNMLRYVEELTWAETTMS